MTNWLGKSRPVPLAKRALALTVPVVASIWLSKVRKVPRASVVAPLWSVAVAGSAAPREDAGQIALRHREADVDRIGLGDGGDAVGVARRHIIADVRLAQTDAT